MSIMTFKTDLIPNTDLGYSLGSNDYKWNIYGQITRQGVSKGWNKGRDGVVAGTTTINGYSPAFTIKTTNGSWDIGAYDSSAYTDDLVFSYVSDALYNGTNTTPPQIKFLEDGSIAANITGNAATATKISSQPNNTTTFLRGDGNWSGNLTGNMTIGTTDADSQRSLTVTALAGNLTLYSGGATTSVKGIWLSAHGTDTTGHSVMVADTNNVTTFYGNLSGNATYATSLQTARTIWGKSFNGTANISGNMTDVGPDMKLPAGQTRFQFITSVNGAAEGYYGKIGLAESYATIASNMGSHNFFNNGTSLLTGSIYRTSGSLGSSWVGSRELSKSCLAVDASDSSSSTAYTLTSIKFPTKTYAIGSERSGNNFGIFCWLNSRTANGYDYAFYINNDTYFRCNTRIYGAVWNDYAEKRNVPEAQQNWTDKECIANPLAGRCVREVGDDTMVLSDARLQKGCKIISDTFGFSIGETENCKTPIAVSGRVLAYLLEDREVAKEHIGDFVCSGPNGTVSIMTTEEYFKCPQACIGTISAIPDYEEWGTGKVKVDGRIWIYVK